MIDKLIDSLISSADAAFLVKTVLRLLLATLLGTFIGNEREHINRPAGIRTHVLVCIGAALMTITSDFVCMKYEGIMNMDPTRLGAQVISGIGFLGAGTIIKEGFSVKGLTTAASLWAVSCVGLTCGTGFYSAAVLATLLIYFMLQVAKKVILRHTETKYISLVVDSADNVSKAAAKLFSKLSIAVVSSEIVVGCDENDEHIELKYVVAVGKSSELFDFAINKLRMEDGVLSVHVE
ncbi:MAG: MgtC/SapB family protein [Oscillospiraceae bacterium]